MRNLTEEFDDTITTVSFSASSSIAKARVNYILDPPPLELLGRKVKSKPKNINEIDQEIMTSEKS